MTITHVTYGMTMGGIETMLVNIANEQLRLGHDIHIVIVNNLLDKSILSRINPDVHLHFINRPVKSKNPFHVFRLNKTLLKIAPDVIHLHFASLSKYIFPRRLKKRFCVTQHDICTHEDIKSLPGAGKIFAISDVVKNDIFSQTRLASTTIYNGIRFSDIPFKNTSKSDGRFKIVQISRLFHEKKGQDILLKAARVLVESGIHDFHITFIGAGPSYDYLINLTKELQLEDFVTFTGNKDQDFVLSHLKDFDLLVQPSRFDGFGLTVAEAMAAKVPVVVSEGQGVFEVIGKGEFGFYFKNGDFKDLAFKIKNLIASPASPDFLENAFLHAKDNFSVEATARNYLHNYGSILIDKCSDFLK